MRGYLIALTLVLLSSTAAWAGEPNETTDRPRGAIAVAVAEAVIESAPDQAKPGFASEPFKHGAWPFRPPQRPELPEVRNAAWAINPIDRFVLAKLEEKGLHPNPEAEKRVLLRRLSYDLTGLPPTPAELAEFDSDQSPEAYSKQVDRLLASPRYGERWAQHWLDVVRYAETDGFKEDAHRPNAFRYRDYVIKSLNDDLPYDRFVRQQIAGDELEPDNPDALVATGLNRLYPDEYNAANVKQRRQEILDDITDTTGLAFLGLTMGCAQCHDHKFDDILQSDYFRLQAFFAPMLPRDDLPVATPQERQAFAEQDAKWQAATAEIRRELDELLADDRAKVIAEGSEKYEAEIQQILKMPPEQRTPQQKQWAVQAMKTITPKLRDLPGKLQGEKKQRYEDLQSKLAAFDGLRPKPLPMAMAITDAGTEAPPTHLLASGSFRKPREVVEPGFPSFLGSAQPLPSVESAVSHSTGRRSALAHWLTRGDHPLTARIMVNRLWAQHFGVGIVATPNDFGVMGERPTHPELLDWLAVEFVDRGWRLKEMHRLMVMSATYRQSSRIDPSQATHAAAQAADPLNHLLWHARRRRLDGESIRDAALFVAGQLNLRMYGPSAKPELPASLSSNYAWKPDGDRQDRNRRSIYVLAKRNLRLPLLETFDLPDMHNSCARRATTTTAPQALALLNGEFSLEQARQWAGLLWTEGGGDSKRLVRAAFSSAFGREPTSEDLAAAMEFLADVPQSSEGGPNTTDSAADTPSANQPTAIANLGSSQATSLPTGEASGSAPTTVVDFCHALLNANEFLYVD